MFTFIMIILVLGILDEIFGFSRIARREREREEEKRKNFYLQTLKKRECEKERKSIDLQILENLKTIKKERDNSFINPAVKRFSRDRPDKDKFIEILQQISNEPIKDTKEDNKTLSIDIMNTNELKQETTFRQFKKPIKLVPIYFLYPYFASLKIVNAVSFGYACGTDLLGILKYLCDLQKREITCI